MEEPTRKSLMESLHDLDVEIGTMLPTTRSRRRRMTGIPIEAMEIMEFDGKNWKLQGDLVEAKAQ